MVAGNRSGPEADNLGRYLLAAHRSRDVIRHTVGHFDERQIEPLEDIAAGNTSNATDTLF